MERTPMKRFLSAVMAIVMLLSLLPLGSMSVFADEPETTVWDFSAEDFTGEGNAYNGLTWTNGQKNKTYLLAKDGTISVPVTGPSDITVSACYQYSFYFESNTEGSVDQNTGSTGQIDSFDYSYNGEAGTVDITVLGTSYLTAISVTPKPVIEVPEYDSSMIDVWDFGAEQLDSTKYNNMLSVDEINSWFPDKEAGSTGVTNGGFISSDEQLEFNGGGKVNHRLRSTNSALTRYDDKSLKDADGNEYTGYIYSNAGSNTGVYVAVTLYAGDKVTYAIGSNGGDSHIVFEGPNGVEAEQDFIGSGAKIQMMDFYPAQTGVYKIYSTNEKLVVARIYREHSDAIAVTGNVSAPAELTGYSLVFTNDLSGATVEVPVENGAYSATLFEGYTYSLSLKNANGYIIVGEQSLAIEAGAASASMDVTVAQVDLVTVSGSIVGLGEEALAKAGISFNADAIYIPEITVSGSSYTAILEKGVTYDVVVSNVNDYVLTSSATVSYDADTTADITMEAKPVYAVTIEPIGATLADLANATFTFTNLNEAGYVYTFTGTEGIVLRDGVYSVKVTNSGAYVQQLTANVQVNGAAVTRSIPFSSNITEWDFSAEDFTGENGSYNTLTWENASKNKTYLLAKAGKISVPVSGPCQILVSACYEYSFYFESEDEASVGQKSGSTSQIDTYTYSYSGSAGTVDINVLGTSYITKIEVLEVVEFKDTVTVGASGCDYTTIAAALEAVASMDRPNGERVTILIQPGNYEEMLVINTPNVTLKNASSAPSIELTNKGVDIAPNAVRITHYYGCGYNYFSMNSSCKYDENVLAVNKENGYTDFVNPGDGSGSDSYWNATVIVKANGFQAEGIIFENSFNQYVSEKSANDVIVPNSECKEGSVPRADLPVGSTAVQDKTYVERAAALAIIDGIKEVSFDNCKFVGRQDTLYGGKNVTAAFYDCDIYGACDYIFGGMTAVFAKCDLVMNTSENNNDVAYITAAQTPEGNRGYLMYNCTVTSTVPGVDTASEYTSKPGYFGRPWAAKTGETVFYNTVIEAADSHWYNQSPSLILPTAWLSSLSGESALCGEYGTYEMALDVDNSASRASWATVFETETLADGSPITVETFLGSWNPFEGKDMTIVIPTEKVDNKPVEEEEPAPGEPTEYTFDSLVDVKLEGEDATKDKAVIPAGTIYSDYFKVIGSLTQRYQESKGGVYAVEIAKNLTGALEFTVSGKADVTITVASTGGSNTSAVAIIDASGNVIGEVSEVTGTAATTLSWTGLEAGTYQIVSPQSDYNRGFRLMTVNVVEVPAVVTTEYTFDSLVDVKLEGEDATKDKAVVPAGTTYADNYFKIVGTVTQRWQESKGGTYAIEIAKNGTGAMEFTVSGSADVTITVASTGGSNTSAVAIIDASGAVVGEVSEVTGTAATTLSWTGLAAGTYQIVSPQSDYNRGFRLMTVNVVQTSSGERPARLDWAQVADPVIVEAKQDGGDIVVSYKMVIGYDGADSVTVQLHDGAGNLIDSVSIADSSIGGRVPLIPAASGSYAVTVIASRADEADKVCASAVEDFVLPLGTPTIASATSIGGGKINLVWDSVAEADSYNIYCDGALVATVSANEYTVSGLTVGTQYSFTMEAVRGTEVSALSGAVTATATGDAQTVWSFIRFGPSTKDANNYYTGSINEEGSVTIYSIGGSGKVQPKAPDGVAYYYTTVDASQNFTLRATVTVDTWKYSNGQEGFGLLAMDSLPEHGAATHWTNQFMAMASKVEYFYDFDAQEVVSEANDNTVKYSMKLGLGVQAKLGLTPENIDLVNANDTTAVNSLTYSTYPLDLTAAMQNLPKADYNVIGNSENPDSTPTTIAEYTTFTLEIQKNNTGYFITYYDAEGNIIGQQKNYDPYALQVLDTENIYVGFFASRNAQITVSDVEFSTIDPKDDLPAEEQEITYITPSALVASPMVSNDESYVLSVNTNVAGTVKVTVDGTVIAEAAASGDIRTDIPVTLTKTGTTKFVVEFLPDPDQDLGEYTELANADPVITSVNVTYTNDYARLQNLYVAPNGKSTNNGSYAMPLDIYTAVSVVKPGQTIVLLEGTYMLTKNVFIARGMDGTADQPIRMIADPKAETRPVLDFSGAAGAEGITHVGSYWYFQGFDVVNTTNGKAGFHVAGHYNTLDQINAYNNGGTGVQISRYQGSDLLSEWPSYNLILNCTAYNNADSGYEDADGFGAKLTIGEGNVFDGCIAYNNADDGWDLYAKVETGAIPPVVIKNCVAYQNGYVIENGQLVSAGNGNGFKMGGSNIPGGHKLINSYAFFNKAKGFDSNSCPDIIVENSIAYNNESYNVAFYTNTEQNTAFKGTGIISFKDDTIKSGLTNAESLKPKGSQSDGDVNIWNDTNYYWDGSQSVNTAGVKVTADWFVSLEFKGVERNADGTINMQGFLELTDKAASNAGARPDGAESPEQTVVQENPFIDVPADRFESAILWAYYNDITTGTGDGSTFSPENACTRKQIVTFLWRAAGEPEPKSMVNPFTDVKADRFEKAILWAYYEGITTGTGDGSTFSPEATCTRKQIVTFLWRFNGEPKPAYTYNPFSDVKQDRFTDAILWAYYEGITTGTGDGTTFSPESPCTRKQIVTFLYRNMVGGTTKPSVPNTTIYVQSGVYTENYFYEEDQLYLMVTYDEYVLDENGYIVEVVSYEVDENGGKTEIDRMDVVCNEAGQVVSQENDYMKVTASYDDQGRPSKQDIVIEGMTISSVYNWKEDNTGFGMKQYLEGELMGSSEYVTVNGKTVSGAEYDYDGTLAYRYTYNWSENDCRLEMVCTDPAGEEIYTEISTYDEHGNVLTTQSGGSYSTFYYTEIEVPMDDPRV